MARSRTGKLIDLMAALRSALAKPTPAPDECRCAGPKYHPDKPCPVHPKNGPHAKEVP